MRETAILGTILVNGGRDIAHQVREGDRDGTVTVHAYNRTQRMIDQLYWLRKAIDATEHATGTALRDVYEKAGLTMANERARDLEAPMGGSGEPPDMAADEIALGIYRRAIIQCGRDWPVLRAVVIDDRSPEEWGRTMRAHGLISLKGALKKLEKQSGAIGLSHQTI